MGCLHSLMCKPRRFRRDHIVVEEFLASIEPGPTVIEESSPIVLRYRTPYFKASARVLLPALSPGHTWVVGFVQACNNMEFYNVYGDLGVWVSGGKSSSWELPPLRDGLVTALSDSDGVCYPWYGNTTEMATVQWAETGRRMGRSPIRVAISMNDNFYPSVTWAVPITNSSAEVDELMMENMDSMMAGVAEAQLTRVSRDQSFTTWLVAQNVGTQERHVLRTVHWRIRLRINVEPQCPLGQRTRLVGPLLQEQPQIIATNEPIPPNALSRPNANDAQVLVWRPQEGPPVVVIPAKQ
uniref:Family with sequence similarity 78 member Bb n=1 Tax=Eptatretus burgeri TaxID=7764 RepID=A0A8C4NGT5_EPTBU